MLSQYPIKATSVQACLRTQSPPVPQQDHQTAMSHRRLQTHPQRGTEPETDLKLCAPSRQGFRCRPRDSERCGDQPRPCSQPLPNIHVCVSAPRWIFPDMSLRSSVNCPQQDLMDPAASLPQGQVVGEQLRDRQCRP